MKRIIRRSVICLLVFTLMLPVLTQVFSLSIGWIDSLAKAESGDQVPEAYSLPESGVGEEMLEGQWHYALRDTDGYAIITGYDGSNSEVSLPTTLNGVDVVGISSGAFDGVTITKITFHGNVMYIAEDALGSNTPEIVAPNGTYALYYAYTHGLKWKSNSKYTLVPGVIDYSEVPSSRIKRRGDSYVWFRALEGSRLSKGCYFHMTDTRSSAYFFQVVALEEVNGGVLATVQEPDLSNVIIEAHINETIVMTKEDCVPAEGIIMDSASSVKARSTSVEQKGIDFTFDPTAGYSRYLSGHFSTKFSASFNVKVSVIMTYTLDIVDQEVIYAESKEETSVKATFNISDSLSGSFKTNKAKDADSKYTFIVPMADMLFTNGIVGLKVNPSFVASLSGSISTSYTHTSVTDKIYDFASQKWVVRKDNGNGSQDKDALSITGTVSGKVGVKLAITVNFFCLINAAEVDVEGGVKISLSATLSTDPNAVPCYIATLDIYCSLDVYVGAWVGGGQSNGNGKNSVSIGAKFNILSREFLLSEWMQKDPLKMHIIPLEYRNEQPDYLWVHIPDRCPFGDRLTVKFDTMTSQQLQPIKVFQGKPVPILDGYNLPNSDQYGQFKGWSTKPGSLQPNWVLGDVNYPVQESMTLYAVWSNTALVQFDSQGGTTVEDQYVPVGGYAEQPDDPENNGKQFQYWFVRDAQGHGREWDFNSDTVPASGVTLYAYYYGDVEETGGTATSFYIGDPNDVEAYYPPDVDSLTEYAKWADYFQYTINSKTLDGQTIQYLTITGLKNNPVNLIVPKSLYVVNGVGHEYMEVTGINSGAFKNCSTLKSVAFEDRGSAWEESISSLFYGCTSLEYADLSNIKLRDGVVSSQAFFGCTALKCVKLPAGIHTIGTYAFNECKSLKTVTVKQGIYSLDESAFKGCTGIETLNLEEGIESISYNAFANCTGLTEIVFPDSLRELSTMNSAGAIKGCTNLRRISIGGVEELKTNMLRIADDKDEDLNNNIEEIEIRGTVKKIGNYALYSGAGLSGGNHHYCNSEIQTRIIIREGVQSIGNYAFSGSTQFTEITIPDSVTSIGHSAFSSCSRLKTLRMSNNLETL